MTVSRQKPVLREPLQIPPIAWDARSMSLPAISFGSVVPQRTTEITRQNLAALKTFSQSLRGVLLRGLSAPTPDAWQEFWYDSENFRTFVDMFAGLRGAVQALNVPDDVKHKAAQQAALKRVAAVLPKYAESLQWIDEATAEMGSLVQTVLRTERLRSEQLRELDKRCQARFEFAQLWAVIAISSLVLMTDAIQQRTPIAVVPSVADCIVEVATECIGDALFIAHAGAQLRLAPHDELYLSFDAEVRPTEDGEGFLGTISEFNLMTCGANADETRQLVLDLVSRYLLSAKRRGVLGRLLASHLRLEDELHPSAINYRVDIRSESDVYTAMGRFIVDSQRA